MAEIFITNETFNTSRSRGEQKEQFICEELNTHSGWQAKRVSAGGSHDILVSFNMTAVRVEIKNEDNNKHTGNVFIEYTQGDPPRPSGILKTQAYLWIHTLGEKVVIYSVKEMLEWAESMKLAYPIAFPGGKITDNNNQGRKIQRINIQMASGDWHDECDFKNMWHSRVWVWNKTVSDGSKKDIVVNGQILLFA